MKLIKTGVKTAGSILGLTASILGSCSERAPGSKGSLCAADKLYEVLSGFCGNVIKETFTMHPGSQFGIGRAIGAAYVLSIVLLMLGNIFCYAAAAFCVVSFVYTVIHYFLYGNSFDCFFKKRPTATL